jgi:hypothetical protein
MQEPLTLQQLADRLLLNERIIDALSKRVDSLTRQIQILEGNRP